jgi:hypothetical protein
LASDDGERVTMSTQGGDLRPGAAARLPETTAVGRTTAGLEATAVTAEIPVTTPVSAARQGPRFAQDRDYEPADLLPAPVGLRLLVWILFFVFLVALVALAVEHYHPDWLSFLRNSSTTASLAVAHVQFG